jgi:hypothetical protein
MAAAGKSGGGLLGRCGAALAVLTALMAASAVLFLRTHSVPWRDTPPATGDLRRRGNHTSNATSLVCTRAGRCTLSASCVLGGKGIRMFSRGAEVPRSW